MKWNQVDYVRRYWFIWCSSFNFKENHVFIEEDNLSEKIVLAEEELDGIDRDDIVNLEDLLRLVLIYETCRNPKVVVDGEELTRNINQKKKPGVLQAYKFPRCNKCYRRDYLFNKHVEYCESVRYDFSCGLVENNLKER